MNSALFTSPKNLSSLPGTPFLGSPLKCRTVVSSSKLQKVVAPQALFGLGKKAKAGGNCRVCKGEGAVTCSGCKGSGKNKKNGNLFERWKCYDCQGFGLVKCPSCGKKGLTPEQRGER